MKLTPEIIIQTVADYFHCDIFDVKSTAQDADYIKVRHVSMYLIRTITGMPYAKIGMLFEGRNKVKDHSTVLYAMKVVNNQMFSNKQYKSDIEEILKDLKSPAFVAIKNRSKFISSVFQENDFFDLVEANFTPRLTETVLSYKITPTTAETIIRDESPLKTAKNTFKSKYDNIEPEQHYYNGYTR